MGAERDQAHQTKTRWALLYHTNLLSQKGPSPDKLDQ
jgi:hypothetical protein